MDLWNDILEYISNFVIPDWAALIGLLPVFIAFVIVLVLAWVFWRLMRAAPPRRGKQRIEPRPPSDVHLPGPSFAPIFGAIGAFLLFLGVIYGGPILVLGAIALGLTLLYWLGEALRIYDRAFGDTVTRLPAVTHDGPPPGVHLPGPSFRPIVGAIGTAMLMLGLVMGGWLLVAGVLALVLTLVGWLVDAVKEFRRTIDADRTGHLENGPPPGTPTGMLATLAILLVVASVLQAIPPTVVSGEGATPGASGAPSGAPPPASGAPPASGGPPASGAPEGPPADVTLVAKDIAFNTAAFSAPAGTPFKIALDNQDAAPHDVALRDSTGAEAWAGEPFTGPKVTVYDVPALPAGTYTFLCTIHPNMTGTATLQ